MKTRDKIASAALLLFNENGERNITTNHIAADLGMSPGNLYYHFKNKEAIIAQIFEGYSVELLAGFKPLDEQQDSLDQLKRYLECIFTLMWKYRFFYANLPQILQRDEILHTKYLAVQKKSQINLHAIFKSFIALKFLNIKDKEVKTLVTSLHLINFSWLSYQTSMSLSSNITEQVVQQGMLHMTNTMKPYTTPLGKQQLILLEEAIKSLNNLNCG